MGIARIAFEEAFFVGVLPPSGLCWAMPSGYTQHYLANERINPYVRNGL